LQNAVYSRLQAKGYRRIDAAAVAAAMTRLGVQTPEMLSGISYARLGAELRADAILQGEVNQSGTQHGGVYDSVVVSCSLRMTDCKTGLALWSADQWRTAHRQWQVDPFNFIINMASHEGASRDARIAWLAQEMLRTLPAGPVRIEVGDLLSRATPITAGRRSHAPGGTPASPLPAPAGAIRTTTVRFDEGSAALSPAAESMLNHLVSTIAGEASQPRELVITGYQGAGESNAGTLSLADARGRACMEWLAAHGPDLVGRVRVEAGRLLGADPLARRAEIVSARRK
jgi:hypothetical protein